ncbi:DUF1883 domain-containing protein [Mycobacteroides immunogenum]|uniref:Uncharacterized protein n=1 Tax=Mycobacteroides immunogenum TaxID=83262 RepID=A0A7V8LL39_9MYCO|nr:DUF1883 domain-containing protein [Mycobacteroides immunogenum]AMT70641.1 hypothetical protein ABG82_10300 [Mycobacteroides immunogenum]ANO03748.1 hypothetical protein BAB75_10490 [Mycobacteroides immunogenum]KPG04611.1 hypothetical protein AN909_22915 [Mycobacteroides immunogenum]KPG05253.1 hypothetical protein AN908_22665 [Mycobacteroides immunogenum]KPG26167.1 hypothetical protein AN913_21680 [Mycobacteroides immunogenum]
MKVPYMNLGQQPEGTVVEVIMQGGEAFVEVLDDNNLGLLTDGQVHTYFGQNLNAEPPYNPETHVTRLIIQH